MAAQRTILVTGASGFVGKAVIPALLKKGWLVRGLTRNLAHADRAAEVDWRKGDIADPVALGAALDGCDDALYLVHSMEDGGDFRERELASARLFADLAATAKLSRIVYLGGMAPEGEPSEHLRSRLDVGQALRAGRVPTVELRASMIVGAESTSWLIVRDLAARLPFMLLPMWLKSRTEPVAIDDVVVALVAALSLPIDRSEAFDIPGPEVLAGRQILDRTAHALGLSPPRMLDVPLLTPRLSAVWVRFVTRAPWSVARRIVVGLVSDILARDDRFWHRIDHVQRLSFEASAKRALAHEHEHGVAPGPWGVVERAMSKREA